MNRTTICRCRTLACSLAPATSLFLLGALPLSAVADTASYAVVADTNVPDGNASGLVSVLNVPAPGAEILDVNVTLDLSGDRFGGWNGDLYVLLAHDGAASVLLNRVGVASGNSFGYGDNGFADLTLDDEAVQGDVHVYQATLGAAGDSLLPITGTWQPDGRSSDPGSVQTTDPRSRLLDEFQGLDAAGEWRLFIADLSPGGGFILKGWQLHLTTGAPEVPEPVTGVLYASTVLCALGGARWYSGADAGEPASGTMHGCPRAGRFAARPSPAMG